ncbi:MAG: hypothetical protein ACTHNW_05150 [Mucilaginibacter sp.]
MKPLYTFSLFACAICFFSCGSKKSADPQSPIVAKWTLQQEHVVVTVDNATTLDTVLKPIGSTYGTIQFNSNGTYSASSVYNTGGTSLQQTIGPSSQSITGTYSYSTTAFSIKPGFAGWYAYVTGSSTPPVTNLSTVQITSLTQSALNASTVVNFSVTTGTGPHTINQACDYSYKK